MCVTNNNQPSQTRPTVKPQWWWSSHIREPTLIHVPGLEAIWIETKINKVTLLIGSFYRQPSATVDCWDLIRQSFWNVNNTGLKFVVSGDKNSDFNFPSKHLVDILHMFQLHQLTNSDTRITPISSTCIDLNYHNPDAPSY